MQKTDPRARNSELITCHPIAYQQFVLLAELLVDGAKDGKPLFLPFEAYRPPERQDFLFFEEKTTKARKWTSAHQYGLAVDFVPYINGQWIWDVPDDYWTYLERCARAHGLAIPIVWDKGHVEHPAWIEVRAALRKK